MEALEKILSEYMKQDSIVLRIKLRYNINAVRYPFVDDYIPYKRRKTVDTELKNAVKATDTKAQYDESAKRLLGQKNMLAHILVKTVEEFKGMNPKAVVSYIEGQPCISTVPIEPGLTNISGEKNGQRIAGFNSEKLNRAIFYVSRLISSQKERDFENAN